MPELPAQSINPLIPSEFAEDVDYRELLELFHESLATQRLELAKACEQKQWHDLKSKAHQLMGAGGGYGFPGLTEAALALETVCDQEDPADIQARMEDLLAYMDRILSR